MIQRSKPRATKTLLASLGQNAEILERLGHQPEVVGELCDDSREVNPGDAFVAVKGAAHDGHAHIDRALAAGAKLIFCERFPTNPSKDICYLRLADTRAALPALVEAFYGRPSTELKVIGITGTNGKTTTTYLLESLGAALGRRVGVLGTISHRYPGFCERAINTTPGLVKLTRILRQMVDAKVDWVAMEVSSHGIEQGRLDGISFDVAAWTNLRPEHLDYHETFEAYRAAKAKLFYELMPKNTATTHAIFHADDPEVAQALKDAPRWTQTWTLSLSPEVEAKLSATLKTRGRTHWEGSLKGLEGEAPFSLPLIGDHNIRNAMVACAAAIALGEPLPEVCAALENAAAIPGRLEAFSGGPKAPGAFVDYAHTPDALQVALETLREIAKGEVWVVFGAGGDRDQQKRPVMGHTAATLADRLVITNDNPRGEDPEKIAAAIRQGVPADRPLHIELDRAKAIQFAITLAAPEDLILVAGKGHEDYQIIAGQRLHMDDRELIQRAYAARAEEQK